MILWGFLGQVNSAPFFQRSHSSAYQKKVDREYKPLFAGLGLKGRERIYPNSLKAPTVSSSFVKF